MKTFLADSEHPDKPKVKFRVQCAQCGHCDSVQFEFTFYRWPILHIGMRCLNCANSYDFDPGANIEKIARGLN